MEGLLLLIMRAVISGLPEIAEALRKGGESSNHETRRKIEKILPPREKKGE
jgi:hypothetical protein